MKRNYRHRRPIFSSPVPKAVREPKIKWRVLPIIWMGLKRTAMLLGFMMLISLTISLILTYNLVQKQGAKGLPDEMVLFLNFEDGVSELPPVPSFFDPFSAGGLTVANVVAALDKASHDPRVKGIYARLRGGRYALSHIQEIRAAVERFKASGKFATIYSSSYGPENGGFGGYYLASVFDEVWMQPMGVVSIPGFNAEMPFFRDVLDRVGVEPQFFQRKEYKTAYESLTNSEMSKPNERAMTALIDDLRVEIAGDIAEDRGLRPATFERLVDKALFTSQAALDSGLITHSDYADILVEDIKTRVTGHAEHDNSLFVTVNGYLSQTYAETHKTPAVIEKRIAPSKPTVAVVYAVGAIMQDNLGGGGNIAAASEIAPAILDATKAEDVQAIILRVDSPGGSPTASESILRAVQRAQKKGKPVIVSMGPTAASGGYWIATSADKIFAMPTTLTGSIGVVGGKFSARDLWKTLGVNWEAVRWGENASLWSLNKPFSESEAEQINAMLDQVYDGFTARVAKGRNMSPAQVEKVARGRVWSGKAAHRVGLVDELGGLKEAKDYVAELLGVESADNLEFVVLPKAKTPLEQFVELLTKQGLVFEGLKFQGKIAEALRPVMSQLNVLQINDPALIYEPLRID